MVAIFRKIRQKLIAEGKLKQYLAYAIGEIILVVAGILIALEINDLQKEKQDRRDERSYLSRLVEDLKMDGEDMLESNEFAFRRIAISTWVLAQLALRHLHIFEQPENGLLDKNKVLLQQIEKQLE
ncbi:MAG: DUF6090 family protein [Bacteroidota bacterium]